ncbi:mucin-3B-like isoform X1 [Gallus gallus]|uniref:SEA domain-containing protein n=1 Tax=Gallus gallus TaxID=9031 RepID=A0A8V0X7R4_CHICK|nr:mucin-3B-like isoform X1 [Gallus gallus]
MSAHVSNRPFLEEMGNPLSPQFRAFASQFRHVMDGVYGKVAGYRGVRVLALSRGSVVVSYRVLLRTPPGPPQIRDLLGVSASAIRPHNCSNTTGPLCFSAFSPLSLSSELELNATELCRSLAAPHFSPYYFAYRLNGSVLCITHCSPGFPDAIDCHRGLCRVTSEGPRCFCPELPGFLSSGDRCQTHISRVGLGVGVGVGLGLPLLLLLLLLLLRAPWGRKGAPNSTSGIYHVNSRASQIHSNRVN